mgnify:FL=1
MSERMEKALLANASCLGFHWIYNREFLAEYGETHTMLMQKQNALIYEQAKPSYYAYPEKEVGTLSVQGEILKWLFEAWKRNPNFNQNDYQGLLYEAFRPGGHYQGYVETYAKRMVYEQIALDLRIPLPEKVRQDDHLVGFLPYLAAKELGHSNQEAFELARLFTNKEEYPIWYSFFDSFLPCHTQWERIQAVKRSIPNLPIHLQTPIRLALELEDTNEFIKQAAGVACAIQQSIPLIIHLLVKQDSLLEALEANVRIGGASAERATLLGFFMASDPLPKEWIHL